MKLTPWLMGMSLMVAGPALAQGFRERAQDRREARKDAAHAWDDQRDLDQLQGILSRMDRARAVRMPRVMEEVDRELQGFVRREWAETQGNANQSRAEASRDAQEARYDGRNASGAAMMGRPGAYGRDARAAREDRRDLRKDERDAQAEQSMAFHVRRISGQLDPLYGRMDDFSLNRKRELLVELIDLGRRQLERDRHEERRDQRDLRQDYRR